MLYDLCIKVKDIGEIFGSFSKSTKTSIYIKNALINKAAGTVIAEMKIDKKYITSAWRMGSISFDEFTNDQLLSVIQLNDPNYTALAEKVLEGRKSFLDSDKDLMLSQQTESSKASVKKNADKSSKKKWNQFEANEALFGVTPEFNIDEYAYPIDKSAPGFKQLQAKSRQIASEIMSSSTSDAHRSEERRIGNNTNEDDDMLYSTVNKESQWDKNVETESDSSVKGSSTDEMTKLTQNLANNLKVNSEKKLDEPKANTQKPNSFTTYSPVKTANAEEKLKIEVGKEIENIKEKAHQDFESHGWKSIASLLAVKKSLEKTLAKPEPVVEPEENFVLENAIPQSDSISKQAKNSTDSNKNNKSSKDRKLSKKLTDMDKSPTASKRDIQEQKPKASALAEAVSSIIKNIRARSVEKALSSSWGSGSAIVNQSDLYSAEGLQCEFFSESLIKTYHEKIKQSLFKNPSSSKKN